MISILIERPGYGRGFINLSMHNNEPEWFQEVLDRTEQTESFLLS